MGTSSSTRASLLRASSKQVLFVPGDSENCDILVVFVVAIVFVHNWWCVSSKEVHRPLLLSVDRISQVRIIDDDDDDDVQRCTLAILDSAES